MGRMRHATLSLNMLWGVYVGSYAHRPWASSVRPLCSDSYGISAGYAGPQRVAGLGVWGPGTLDWNGMPIPMQLQGS